MDLLTLALTMAFSVGLGLAGTRAILEVVFTLMNWTMQPAAPRTVEIITRTAEILKG